VYSTFKARHRLLRSACTPTEQAPLLSSLPVISAAAGYPTAAVCAACLDVSNLSSATSACCFDCTIYPLCLACHACSALQEWTSACYVTARCALAM
jgi:hypothetical protein